MEVDDESESKKSDAMETEETKESSEETKDTSDDKTPTPVKEPDSFMLDNPARVTHAQTAYLEFDTTQRYVPIVPRVRLTNDW